MAAWRRSWVLRVAAASLAVALLAAGVGGWLARRDRAEELQAHWSAEIDRVARSAQGASGPASAQAARLVADLMELGFDAAAVLDAQGRRLAYQGPHADDWLRQPPTLADGRAATQAVGVIRRTVPRPHGEPAWTVHALRTLAPLEQRLLQRDTTREVLEGALVAGLAALLGGGVTIPVLAGLWRDNQRKTQALAGSYLSTMEALGRAIARRDSDTGAHNYRVAWMAAELGQALGLDPEAIRSLVLGSFLHDVGKIAIPDRVLLKPGRLDEEEWRIMRTHVAQGEAILEGIEWLAGARQVVAAHHERWDGSGYPRGLAGEAIPLAARIFAVVDVFDALTSRRPYKEPFALAQALEMMERERGRHFDPAVLQRFLELAPGWHAKLQGLDEAQCRALLHAQLRRWFDGHAPAASAPCTPG
ncbi:HD-GYP domain-containing protein [Tepidimonas alkaliphilus]|uniref:HD-GYP domain-containing protein n=1 Tax=Tepidimonas alkaliphilus TaxID=2588942 RepID=UPI00117ED466|nr:HD-GYP domain-containing protein [Tepidimonas alkaliphilus]